MNDKIQDMLPTEELLNLYKSMLRIRQTEELMSDLVLAKEIKCPCHLYSGEEAIAVGICAHLSPKDYIFSGHRSHGHYLAKGGEINALFAEVLGKETGCSRGRGGSMHLIDPQNGLLGSAPIVAGTMSLATGAALASKIRGDDRVTVSFFGDGATGEGVLAEALNFAALKKLSIIFACENNLYSTHMPIRQIRVSPEIVDLAKPFGISGFQVDGNNLFEVYKVASQAVQECRRGNGPVFIEFLTYRQRGHVGPDDNIQGAHTDIRPKEEIEVWMQKDPIRHLEQYLIKNDLTNRKDLELIRDAALEEVEGALAFARNSPYPKAEDLHHYVYAA
jgi:acetoin:2,6-dichlorophenolindophenol oxidoreductase subunit alpha